MTNWHRAGVRGELNLDVNNEGSQPVRSFASKVFVVTALVVPVVSCAGRERDFTTESGIAGTASEIPSGASGSLDAGDPELSNPTTPSRTEETGASGTSLDTAGIGGTGLCDADAGCTCNDQVQSCNPLPLCDGGVDCAPVATCTGCIIDEECVAAGSPNPGNLCQVCDPDKNSNGWSNADGVACDDNAFCTVGDACQGGECVGSARACDDDVACNGVSTCDEAGDTCTPGSSQCGANSACDATTGDCVSTCAGCVVSGTCHPMGAEEPGNPCRICDPARSTSAFVAANGKSCGAPPGVCSGQDACDAQGQCQPNHLADGTACGNPAGSACDGPDTCDGRGNCLPRIAANSAACDDGRFCTVGDACQGGVCSPTGNRNCGAGLLCNENADQCRCQGCVVGGNCFAPGASNGNTPCQVCDPTRSTTGFSPSSDPLCQGLVGYYPFNGDGHDATGNGADCIITGPVLTPDRLGRANRAYHFDGDDDEIACVSEAVRLTGTLSVAAWFNPEPDALTGDNQTILSKGLFSGQAASRSYALHIQNQQQSGAGLCGATHSVGFLVSEAGTSTTPDGTLCANTALTPNTWHHAVGVFQPSARLAVYIDGQLAAENASDVVSQAFDVERSLRVGINGESVFNGALDEIRIYNRALTQADVTGLFNSTQ